MDDPAAAFTLVVRIANATVDVRSGWGTLMRALANHCDAETVSGLSTVDIERDVESVRQQLSQIVQGDPPPDDIDVLWFGLFDAVDGEGADCIGYYVAGIRGFDEDDPDWRCSPAWWPEGRYLASAALAAVKQAEVEARRRGADGQSAYLSYAGQLGAALLVSRFGAAELAGPRRVVVGFDSGDYAVVDVEPLTGVGEPRNPTDADTIVMFRPTGPEELKLVEQSGFRRWPPRLPDQPIFYPVTNEEYAVQIARDWNVPASGYGCVTRFEVEATFMAQFPVRQVGGDTHTEWWVPAERLDELNDNIVGLIEVVREFGRRHAK